MSLIMSTSLETPVVVILAKPLVVHERQVTFRLDCAMLLGSSGDFWVLEGLLDL